MLKQGPNVLPQARRALDMLAGNNPWNRSVYRRLCDSQYNADPIVRCRAIPYVLITNGGGVPDEDRRKALSSELGHEVSMKTIITDPCMTSVLISFDRADVHCFIALGRPARSVTHSLEAVGQTVCRQARLVSRRKGRCDPQNCTVVSSTCDALSCVRPDGSFSLT